MLARHSDIIPSTEEDRAGESQAQGQVGQLSETLTKSIMDW